MRNTNFTLFYSNNFIVFFHYHSGPLYPTPWNHHTVGHVHEFFFLFAQFSCTTAQQYDLPLSQSSQAPGPLFISGRFSYHRLWTIILLMLVCSLPSSLWSGDTSWDIFFDSVLDAVSLRSFFLFFKEPITSAVSLYIRLLLIFLTRVHTPQSYNACLDKASYLYLELLAANSGQYTCL